MHLSKRSKLILGDIKTDTQKKEINWIQLLYEVQSLDRVLLCFLFFNNIQICREDFEPSRGLAVVRREIRIESQISARALRRFSISFWRLQIFRFVSHQVFYVQLKRIFDQPLLESSNFVVFVGQFHFEVVYLWREPGCKWNVGLFS